MTNFFQKYTLVAIVVLLLSVTVSVDAFVKGIEGQGCLTAELDCEPGYKCVNHICRWPKA